MRQIFLLTCLALVFFAAVPVLRAENVAVKEDINYYNDGVKAQNKKDFDNAAAFYYKTLLINPSSSLRKFVVNNMGVMYYEQGNYALAEKAFLEALSIDPALKSAQYNLGLVYEKTRTHCQALEYWVKIFDLMGLKPKSLSIDPQK